MFDYLRRKTQFCFLVFTCALLSANALYASNNQSIGADVAHAGITSTSANFTGISQNEYGTGQKNPLYANAIQINYDGNNVDGLRTVGTVNMSGNTLTISGGEMQLSGINTAAAVDLFNQSVGKAATDLNNFNFALKDNVVNMNAKIGESQGTIYGATLLSTESGVGNTTVQDNKIVFGNAANTTGSAPNFIGGSMEIDTTLTDISVPNTAVSGNIINATNTLTTNQINGNMTGGEFLLNISEDGTHKTYNVNVDVNGNKILLDKAKFYGDMTGGIMKTQTDAEYNTLTLTGDIQNNEINIAGGKYDSNNFIGGHLSLSNSGLGKSSTASVDVHDNKITISGGQFSDAIFVGGMTTRDVKYTAEPTGNITGNTIEISGNPTFQNGLYLFGGYTTGDNAISGNTLILKTSGINAYGVDHFDTYKFDVSGANAGEAYLSVSRGNGNNNRLFNEYENGNRNKAIDVDGATFTWKDTSLPEDGRPVNLGVSDSISLLTETSGLGLTGTIANNGVEESVVSGGNTYYYKVLQTGNTVKLLHNGLNVGANWTDDIVLHASNNTGEDVFMHVDGGTINASSINVSSTAAAAAQLTANTLDVTTQNTALNLSGTSGNQVKFNTINVGDGFALTKSGSGYYSFDNMVITGSGAVNTLDAFNGATANVTTGTSNTFETINVGAGSNLTITGTYDFNTMGVYGDTNTFTGNLNAANKNLNFYLADTTTTADTALNVTGTADITDSNVQVGITGASSPLKKEDQVVLLNAGTLTGVPATTTGVGMQGLLLKYNFDLSAVGNQLIATVTKTGLTQESKAFAEGRAASIGLLTQGADFMAQTGIASAANAAKNQNSLALFTAFGGGKTRLNSGSHVDVNAFNAAVGLSREVSIFKADFVVASFVEHGRGHYNSVNDFDSGTIKGSGDTTFTGLGAFARWYGQDGSYVEGLLHSGITDTDFSGAVFYADKKTKYDFDTWYYGGHFGVGHVWNLFDEFDGTEEDAIQIDGSVKYFLNHQESKEVTLTGGDKLTFHEANSSRVRAGLKANFFASRVWRPYIGGAYDYEFDGKAKSSAYDMEINAPSIKGGTGIGELGLSYVTKGFTFGLGAEAYAGVRRGWSGNAKIGFTF